jgi:hypothetical protein
MSCTHGSHGNGERGRLVAYEVDCVELVLPRLAADVNHVAQRAPRHLAHVRFAVLPHLRRPTREVVRRQPGE